MGVDVVLDACVWCEGGRREGGWEVVWVCGVCVYVVCLVCAVCDVGVWVCVWGLGEEGGRRKEGEGVAEPKAILGDG